MNNESFWGRVMARLNRWFETLQQSQIQRAKRMIRDKNFYY